MGSRINFNNLQKNHKIRLKSDLIYCSSLMQYCVHYNWQRLIANLRLPSASGQSFYHAKTVSMTPMMRRFQHSVIFNEATSPSVKYLLNNIGLANLKLYFFVINKEQKYEKKLNLILKPVFSGISLQIRLISAGILITPSIRRFDEVAMNLLIAIVDIAHAVKFRQLLFKSTLTGLLCVMSSLE